MELWFAGTMRGFTPAPHQGHCPWALFPETAIHITQTVFRWNSVTRTHTFANEDCIFANWEHHWCHADTHSQRKIVFLRIGCPHCGPRAGRCGTPPAGCFASGENMKKDRRESELSRPTFFNVFIAPVGSLSVLQATCGKKFGRIVFYVAERVQGRWPCCGGQGLHKPLPKRNAANHQKTVTHTQQCT